MGVLERTGWDERSGRSLFVLDASDPADVPPALDVDGPFVCLLAWDAAASSVAEISSLADRLLAAGCVYLCTWGPGCGRVHDVFDEADIARSPEGPWAMSTWHDDEPLDEAIWFLLFSAHPDPRRADACRSAVGISIGMPSWAAAIRTAMQEPSAFNRRIVGDEFRGQVKRDVPAEIDEAFYAGQRLSAVPFVINDTVEVVSGPQRGRVGAVISIEAMTPTLTLRVELEDGTDAVVDASSLRLVATDS